MTVLQTLWTSFLLAYKHLRLGPNDLGFSSRSLGCEWLLTMFRDKKTGLNSIWIALQRHFLHALLRRSDYVERSN